MQSLSSENYFITTAAVGGSRRVVPAANFLNFWGGRGRGVLGLSEWTRERERKKERAREEWRKQEEASTRRSECIFYSAVAEYNS